MAPEERRSIGAEHPRISDEAIALYRHVRTLDPNSREYIDRGLDLDCMLDRRPWMESIWDVAPYEDLERPEPAGSLEDRAGAVLLRRALEALA